MMMECIFCHKEKLVTDIVYEDDMVMAFMDMDPINEGHVLLVPKNHYLDVDEMPDEILTHLMLVSKKIVAVLKEIYICSSAKKHTSIPEKQIVSMVLDTLCATGELMMDKDMSFQDVVSRVATKGGITEEGTKVVYESFPEISDELFNKTLDKRKQTAQKAEELFG